MLEVNIETGICCLNGICFFKKNSEEVTLGTDKGNFFLTYFVNDVCLMGFAPSASSVLIPWQ